ncbi:LOW QUALITY PROTEIN: hypothetical protein RJ641_025154, partial [Dillenia turbinata]
MSNYGYAHQSSAPPLPDSDYHLLQNSIARRFPASNYDQLPYPTDYFPPGIHPEVIRRFEMNRSGFIDETELEEALSWGYQAFSIRTTNGEVLGILAKVLVQFFGSNIFFKKEDYNSSSSICSQAQMPWIDIHDYSSDLPETLTGFFFKFSIGSIWAKIRSRTQIRSIEAIGKINSLELKGAFCSLGYIVPPSVLHVLISKYIDGSSRRAEFSSESFV